MKKLLQYFGFADIYQPIQTCIIKKSNDSSIDMKAFTKWAEELNVSTLARSSEFTVTIGDHVKYVTLDRL